MITIRSAAERGHFDHGWLDTHHTFSFGEYYDPNFMGFRALRVINEDHIAPGVGFPRHHHRDMEIITYVLSGAIEHKDSLGTGSVIRPGDGQRMSAGTGIFHSEMNASKTDPLHLLQIWMLPKEHGIKPGYEQKQFPEEEKRGRLRVIASPDGREGSVIIHQDASVYASLLKPGEKVQHSFVAGRAGWLQIAQGAVKLNGKKLAQGDGAAINEEDAVTVEATADSEVLLFDMA